MKVIKIVALIAAEDYGTDSVPDVLGMLTSTSTALDNELTVLEWDETVMKVVEDV
jgi:hypothetical protein